MYVYYCRTYEKAVSGGGEREKGGHVLRDTTSRLFSEEEKEKKIHELQISVSHIGFVYGSVCQPNLVSVFGLWRVLPPCLVRPGWWT